MRAGACSALHLLALELHACRYGDYNTPEETFPDKPVPGNWQVIYHGVYDVKQQDYMGLESIVNEKVFPFATALRLSVWRSCMLTQKQLFNFDRGPVCTFLRLGLYVVRPRPSPLRERFFHHLALGEWSVEREAHGGPSLKSTSGMVVSYLV